MNDSSTERSSTVPPPVPPPVGVPVLPLTYVDPGPGRPGVLTAIGIVSIVFACWGLLQGLMGIGQLLAARVMTPTVVTAPATAPAAPAPLPAGHVQAVITQVERLSGKALSAAQKATITAKLTEPGQTLVPEAGSPEATAAQVNYASKDVSGEISFVVYAPTSGSTASLSVTGDGTVRNFSSSSSAAFAMPVAATFASRKYMLTNGLMGMGSAALGALLLVAGIQVFRQSPGARRLHLIYAGLKIPLAVLSGVVTAYLMQQMWAGMGTAPGMSPGIIKLMTIAAAVLPVGMGSIYPVILLIALNTRQVKEYYGVIRGGRRT